MSPHLLRLRNHKEGLSCTCTIEACTYQRMQTSEATTSTVDMSVARMGGSSRTKKSATLKGGHVPPSPPPKSATGIHSAEHTQCRTYTVQSIHSAEHTQCRAYTVQSIHSAEHTQCRAYTVQNIHSAEHTQCRAYTVQSIHSAEHTQCRAYTVQNIHSAEHTQCRAYTVQSIHSAEHTQCRTYTVQSQDSSGVHATTLASPVSNRD